MIEKFLVTIFSISSVLCPFDYKPDYALTSAVVETVEIGFDLDSDSSPDKDYHLDKYYPDVSSTSAPVLKQISKITIPTVQPVEKPVDAFDRDFTKKEKEILYRIVEAETDINYKSKYNVATIIYNRLKSNEFPDNVEDVVFQKKQFSPVSDGRYYKVIVSDETKQAVKDAYNKKNGTHNALYFCMPEISQANRKWFDTLEFLFKDSVHEFYK